MSWNCTHSQIDSTHKCTTKYILLSGDSLLIADHMLLVEEIAFNTRSVCCTYIQYIHRTYRVAALLWATTPTHNYFTHLAECITLHYGSDLKGQDFQPHGELKREERSAIWIYLRLLSHTYKTGSSGNLQQVKKHADARRSWSGRFFFNMIKYLAADFTPRLKLNQVFTLHKPLWRTEQVVKHTL